MHLQQLAIAGIIPMTMVRLGMQQRLLPIPTNFQEVFQSLAYIEGLQLPAIPELHCVKMIPLYLQKSFYKELLEEVWM